MPELMSAAFLSALFAIVLIDLVLAGDNALIIGLVARNLPKDKQNKVIFWGTFGAIAVRALMAIIVVYILDLPGFMLQYRCEFGGLHENQRGSVETSRHRFFHPAMGRFADCRDHAADARA